MSYSEYFECGVVSYCRKVFGKEYANMWIDVIKADDTYFDNVWNFFKHVEVKLYLKIHPTPKLKDYHGDIGAWRHAIWCVAHEDITENKRRKVKPIQVIVEGKRYSKPDGKFYQRYTKFLSRGYGKNAGWKYHKIRVKEWCPDDEEKKKLIIGTNRKR